MGNLDEWARWNREQEALEAKLGRRGYGERQVRIALDEVYNLVRYLGGASVHGDEDTRGLYGLLEDATEKCTDVIPGDESFPQNSLGELAHVIGLAFELGRYAAGGGADLKEIQRRRFMNRKGALAAAAAKSDKWKAVARPIFDHWFGKVSDLQIVEKIAVELNKKKLSRSDSTVLKIVKAWKKESVS